MHWRTTFTVLAIQYCLDSIESIVLTIKFNDRIRNISSHYEGIKAWETSQSRTGRTSGTVPAISESDLGQLNIEGVFMNPSFVARGKFASIHGGGGNQDSSKRFVFKLSDRVHNCVIVGIFSTKTALLVL